MGRDEKTMRSYYFKAYREVRVEGNASGGGPYNLFETDIHVEADSLPAARELAVELWEAHYQECVGDLDHNIPDAGEHKVELVSTRITS